MDSYLKFSCLQERAGSAGGFRHTSIAGRFVSGVERHAFFGLRYAGFLLNFGRRFVIGGLLLTVTADHPAVLSADALPLGQPVAAGGRRNFYFILRIVQFFDNIPVFVICDTEILKNGREVRFR
ncbi:MAG: hypothetical protein HFI58_11595 [Lachnospiraceae bacterium]|nr:hypothetical protein [Lachnospiraceae bacterium]